MGQQAQSKAASGAAPTVDPQKEAWQQEQAYVQQNAPVQPAGERVKTTQYGWKDDTNPGYAYDRNSNILHIGNRDNPLTPHAAALTDLEAKKLGAKPGDALRVGDQVYYYADRAPQNEARVDLFQPQGYNKSIPDFQNVRLLGGGSDSLRGQELSNAGEANVQKYMQPKTTTPPNEQAAAPMPEMSTQATAKPMPWSARASNNGIAFINLLNQLKLGQRNA